MDFKKARNVWILIVFGLIAMVIATGCIGEEKKNDSEVVPTSRVTPEQEVVVDPVSQETSGSGISSSTGSMMERYSLERLT